MWKEVNGFWKVLRPRERLSSSRVNSDYEAPAEFSGFDDAKDDVESERDRNS